MHFTGERVMFNTEHPPDFAMDAKLHTVITEMQ